MAEPAHRPPGDTSFRDSLTRNAGAAGGLVLAAILVFWGLSAIGNDDGVTVAGPPSPTPSPTVTAGPTATPTVAPSSTAAPTPSPEPAPTATITATPKPSAVANLTIQLIDAVLEDDGAAVARVKDTMAGAGYRIRFETASFRVHDETKIWFTPGNEDAAKALRQLLGFGLVEPNPPNMQAQVDLNVVVGKDA